MKGMLPKSWENMHHAYVIVGLPREASSEVWVGSVFLWKILEEELGFVRQANPDAYFLQADTFGIDESRDLANWSIKRPFGERKVAVIGASSITSEAQNALLKLFEEPTPNTYFFITVSSIGSFLPTLLSRIHIIDSLNISEKNKEGQIFLESSVAKRLKIIAPIIKNKDKDKARKLISNISTTLLKLRGTSKERQAMQYILEAERFLGGRSPSIKMILEHLAIMI